MKNIFQFHKRIVHSIALLGCLSFFSCKEWIEVPAPIDKIPSEVVFVDSTSVMTALAGIYANFGYLNTGSSINGTDITLYPSLSSDELIVGSSDVNIKQFELNAILPDNYNVAGLWRTGYQGIYRVNAAIEGITKSQGINDRLKKRLIAEIKVARALYYFNLVNLYAGVPLITSTDYAVNAKLPRASEAEIYQLMVDDLTDARNNLEASYPSAGRARPNYYTATAFLAKIYLYQKKWKEAETMAKEVIGSDLYSLLGDINQVFLAGSKEAIWQLPTAANTSGQVEEASKFVPFSATAIPPFYLRSTLINAFEAKDKRMKSWLKDVTVSGNTYYYPFKYKNSTSAATPREDYVLFRLSEQYLILAEALVKQGKSAEALPYINKIRARADLLDIAPQSDNEFLAAIMQERRVELFCERGHRWFDLKRTGTVHEVLSVLKPNTWKADDALYPIALEDLLYNGYLQPNPGY